MTKKSKKRENDKSVDYLLAEYQITSEQIFKLQNRSSDALKFYITLLTALGGLLIFIIPGIKDLQIINQILSLSLGVLFIVGIVIFIHMLQQDRITGKLFKLIDHIKKQIAKETDLEEFFDDWNKSNWKINYSYSGRSLSKILVRGIKNAGWKTQIILINSLVGTTSVAIGINSNISIEYPALIIICIGIFGFLVLVHGMYIRFTEDIID